MSRSPSPSEQVSLCADADSWSDGSPVKVKSVVQRPARKTDAPAATSSPRPRDTRRDAIPHRKRAASPSEAWRDHSSCPGKKGKSKRSCPLCMETLSHPLRRHAFQRHVPAISDPTKICWTCGETFLQTSQMEKHLVGACKGGSYLDNVRTWAPLLDQVFRILVQDLGLREQGDLIKFAMDRPEILPEKCSPLNEDVLMMNGYYDFLGAVPPRVYSYSPPNVLTSLLHWRILAHLVLKLSPAAQGRLFGLHKQAFGKGPAQAPTATVSVPPPSPQVMPAAPPVQPMQCKPPRRVVPLAPLDSQFHRPQAPAIPSASRQSQACPRNQPVVPMAPPRQQQPAVNPPVRNQPVAPLAPLQQPRSNNQAVMPSAPQFQQGMEMVTSQAVPLAPSSSMPPSLPLAGMDAHFHLDRLYIKMRAKHHSNVSTSLWRRPPKISCEMTRCVPSYCFPEIWPTPEYLMGSLPAGADRFAMGWHPTRINDFFCPNKGYAFQSKFVQCLSLERCIAVGEVGIDYERERNPEHRLQQEELLACMVEKAKLAKKPLLLHIRDHGEETAAFERCREVLVRTQLPSTWPIYLHCYSYGWRELGLWLCKFSNVIVGLAPWIIKDTSESRTQFIKDLDPDRYVLETDAPYFITEGYPLYGAPCQIFQTAQRIAQIKKLPVELVLRDATRNCIRFYGMEARG